MEWPTHKDDQPSFSKDPSEALEEIMTNFGSTVLRTAFFYIGDRFIAEDISQEVFLRVYNNWARFRGESSVKTWIIKITINLCRDRLRKKSPKEEIVDPSQMILRFNYNLEDDVLRRINNTEILKHVLSIPTHYQEALYLYYYLDLSTTEIAKIIGRPEGTVRTRLSRARELLAKEIDRRDGND
ncbi:RNA polymerase sigma factor [Fredinandcohnia humi]